VVDSNQNKESPFNFTVGKEGVIKGLDIGIKTMKLNEKTVFKVPPEFAYGEKGSGNIPENETLYFEAELLSIKEKEKEITDYS